MLEFFPSKMRPFLLAKRIFDWTFSFAALLFLGPVLLLCALLVRISLGSPVLFAHTRPGFRGKPFVLYKFRTMREALDPSGNPLPDEGRMTWIGSFLRKTSLDEIPQFFNVLRGEISLIGPRPLLMEYLPLYDSQQRRRHDVLPGISGWAQVNGRNAIFWEQKFALDVWYVDHWSLLLDARIFFRTIQKIFVREGISQTGHVTIEKFHGNMVVG